MDVHVALLCDLGNSVAIHRELGGLTSIVALENGVKLAVHKDIGVATDGGGEVGVDGDVESIVTVFGNVEHASTEVLRTLSGLLEQDVDDAASARVVDGVQRAHKGARGRDVKFVTQAIRPLGEGSLVRKTLSKFVAVVSLLTHEATLQRTIVTAEQCLLREMYSDLLGDSKVGGQHKLDRVPFVSISARL